MAIKRPVRQEGYVTRGVLEDAVKKIRRNLEDGAVAVPQGNIPKGTGFRHITNDLEDPNAKTVSTTDIDDQAVSYVKLQNASATDVIVGRKDPGPGSLQEIACTAAGRALIDDLNAAAQRVTLGLGPQANIPDPAGGAVIDVEARAAIVLILDLLEAVFLMNP